MPFRVVHNAHVDADGTLPLEHGSHPHLFRGMQCEISPPLRAQPGRVFPVAAVAGAVWNRVKEGVDAPALVVPVPGARVTGVPRDEEERDPTGKVVTAGGKLRTVCGAPLGLRAVLTASGKLVALGGHATAGVVGTVAESLDAGVIFTAEVRVSLSDRGTPRVLFATSAPSFVSQRWGVGRSRVPVLPAPGPPPVRVAAGPSNVLDLSRHSPRSDCMSGAGTSLSVDQLICPTLFPSCLTYDLSHHP